MTESALRRFQEEQAVGGRILPLLTRLWPGAVQPAVNHAPRTVAPSGDVTVSVVIPCYNYARYLRPAVESAVSQRGVRVEVIVVNDRSTDRSGEVAEALAQQYPQVRAMHNETNVGHVVSFNRGWSESVGTYVVKLDADDLLAPDALARATALLEAHPSVGLAYGHPRHFQSLHPPVARASAITWTVWRGDDWLAERARLGVSAITNPEMVLRAALLRRFGAMNPAVPYAPDLELSLRIAAVADIGRVGGADQALHREHATSMSETDGSGILVDLEARLAAFDAALAHVEDAALRARLHVSARRALASDAVRFASAAADRGRGAQAELTAFALLAFPAIAGSREFRRLRDGGAARAPRRGSAILRRVQRKLRHEAYYSRWMVSGV